MNYELCDLLLEYNNKLKELFPISKTGYIETDVLIKRIRECIDKKCPYDFSDFRNDNLKKMSKNVEKSILSLIIETMKEHNNYCIEDAKRVTKLIEERNNGKKFTFSEHIEALIYSMLINHRWGTNTLNRNKDKIDKIFYYYDKDYLKKCDPEELLNKLKEIHCTNSMIKYQLKGIKHNIEMFELIEKDYGSLDNYVTTVKYNTIVYDLSEGKYYMRQIGQSTTINYLKRVGINVCYANYNVRRLFGVKRLNIYDNDIATIGDSIAEIISLAKMNNISEIEVEEILNCFSYNSASNICGEIPKCSLCKLKGICNKNKKTSQF